MRAALTIALRDLSQRIRDRSALVMSIVAPFVLTLIFAVLLPASVTEFHADYAFVGRDSGPIAASLREVFAGLSRGATPIADLRDAADEAEARRLVEEGEVDAAVIVPAGFDATVQAGGTPEVRVIGSVNSALSVAVARAIVDRFGSRLQMVSLSVAGLEAGGASLTPEEAAMVAQAAQAAPEAIPLVELPATNREATLPTYYAAGMAILFVFFAAQFAIGGLLVERRQGTLARMVAAPIAPRDILLGKTVEAIAFGALAMGVLAVASTLLLGARWGDPLAVALLILGAATAATGVSLLITGFTSSIEQSSTINAIAAMVLGILGGSMIQLSQAPELLAQLSLATPHAWFLRGVNDLAGGGGVEVILPSLAVLFGIAVVTGGIGLLRARRVVAP